LLFSKNRSRWVTTSSNEVQNTTKEDCGIKTENKLWNETHQISCFVPIRILFVVIDGYGTGWNVERENDNKKHVTGMVWERKLVLREELKRCFGFEIVSWLKIIVRDSKKFKELILAQKLFMGIARNFWYWRIYWWRESTKFPWQRALLWLFL